jgi:predicted MFS family arabinose efflux permease
VGFRFSILAKRRSSLSIYVIPLVLVVLLGLLVGLLIWELVQSRRQSDDDELTEPRERLLVGLLILAVLAMGSFCAYLLIGFQD